MTALFLIILSCIVLLVLLVSWANVNAFLAFLIVSIVAGLSLGIPMDKVIGSVQKGLGDTLGSLAIIVCLGAMLGKLVAASGAAQKIAETLVQAVGTKYIQWALVVAGFVMGIPLFYGIGFVLVVPLIFSICYKYKLPTVYIGLPMIASLSVTHGFLPPHPSPVALIKLFHADMGKTLIYGMMLAIPAIILAGPVFAQSLKKIKSEPLATFRAEDKPESELPSALACFFTALLPVILLMGASLYQQFNHSTSQFHQIILFLGDPAMVMIITIIFATFSLGISQGRKMKQIAVIYTDAIKDISLILLIIGASGSFKQVLTDSGMDKVIASGLTGMNMPPLLLGWLIAAIIRVSLGSATVAGLTAAGIMAGMMTQNHVDPNLMVLAIGAGSLAFSHVNDSGFWLFKEYFNISIKDTIRSWSLMETIVSLVGLVGVLVLDKVVG